MPVADYLKPSGQRRFKGQAGWLYEGAGRIHVARAPVKGVDSHLWALLKLAVDALKIDLNISSIDTGQHATNSRHYDGRAVDISRVGEAGKVWRPATLLNADAVRLVQWLMKQGVKVGEGRPQPALLFGPVGHKWNSSRVNHADHLHLSLPRAPGEVPGDAEPEPEDDV